MFKLKSIVDEAKLQLISGFSQPGLLKFDFLKEKQLFTCSSMRDISTL